MLEAHPDPRLPTELLAAYNSNSIRTHKEALRRLLDFQQRRLGPKASLSSRSLNVITEDHLPRMAWLCVINASGYNVHVGPAVEVGARSVLEGVWDADFASGHFQRSQYVFGSGVVWGRTVV